MIYYWHRLKDSNLCTLFLKLRKTFYGMKVSLIKNFHFLILDVKRAAEIAPPALYNPKHDIVSPSRH